MQTVNQITLTKNDMKAGMNRIVVRVRCTECDRIQKNKRYVYIVTDLSIKYRCPCYYCSKIVDVTLEEIK